MKPLPVSLIKRFYYTTVVVVVGVAACSTGVTALIFQGDQLSRANSAFYEETVLASQITSLSSAYAAGNVPARPALISSIGELIALVSNDSPAIAQPLGARRPRPDRKTLDAFIADAQAITNTPPGVPVACRLLTNFLGVAGSLAEMEHSQLRLQSADQMQNTRWCVLTLQFVVFLIVGFTLAVQALWLFRPLLRRIATYADEIIRLATTDSLTGLGNRRFLLERGAIEQARAQRYQRPLSLLMIDADHFKRVNDTYGHDAGDYVLCWLAGLFLQTFRQTDAVARLGGEEFAMLLPETDLKGAIYAAERIRLKVAEKPIKFRQAIISVTLSIGVTMVNRNAEGIEEALVNADELLYRAKSLGRNCVVASPIDYTGLETSLS